MRAQISVLEGEPKGAVLVLEGPGSYSVGRSSSNDLIVRGRSVSRQHCVIEHDAEFFWLVDAHSANGTRVNGAKIQRYLLFDGDVIEVGDARLVFRLQGEKSQ